MVPLLYPLIVEENTRSHTNFNSDLTYLNIKEKILVNAKNDNTNQNEVVKNNKKHILADIVYSLDAKTSGLLEDT